MNAKRRRHALPVSALLISTIVEAGSMLDLLPQDSQVHLAAGVAAVLAGVGIAARSSTVLRWIKVAADLAAVVRARK